MFSIAYNIMSMSSYKLVFMFTCIPVHVYIYIYIYIYTYIRIYTHALLLLYMRIYLFATSGIEFCGSPGSTALFGSRQSAVPGFWVVPKLLVGAGELVNMV